MHIRIYVHVHQTDGSMNLAVDGIRIEFELLNRLLNLTIQVRVRIDGEYNYRPPRLGRSGFGCYCNGVSVLV